MFNDSNRLLIKPLGLAIVLTEFLLIVAKMSFPLQSFELSSTVYMTNCTKMKKKSFTSNISFETENTQKFFLLMSSCMQDVKLQQK